MATELSILQINVTMWRFFAITCCWGKMRFNLSVGTLLATRDGHADYLTSGHDPISTSSNEKRKHMYAMLTHKRNLVVRVGAGYIQLSSVMCNHRRNILMSSSHSLPRCSL